jgi:hypothetical protein
MRYAADYFEALMVSNPLCYEYDIHKYHTVFSLTQINFFITDIPYKGVMFRRFQTAIFRPITGRIVC